MSTTLKQQWSKLKQNRNNIDSRTEDYARWTLPYIFPDSTDTSAKDQELAVAAGSIGARSTNHLANKLVSTLFIPYRPFFRLLIGRDVMDELTANGELSEAEVELILSRAESDAMQSMNIAVHRTQAVLAAKNLIVTGNSLLYYEKSKDVEVYNFKDFCVRRDLSGKIIQIMTRDTKAFGTFSKEVKQALREGKDKKYEDDTAVELFTNIQWEDNKYVVTQAADLVDLDTRGSYPAKKLPWIVLTWNLVRGEDYGRGLVEDYAYAFHAHAVLTAAQMKLYAIMADIKFYVNPTSQIDVDLVVKSDSGSYHTGKKDEIWTPDLGKRMDMAAIDNKIQTLEREIAQAFLLNSAITRDAERVTAEEIRMQVQELEMSHGGIYSRLAAEWQTPLVALVLQSIDFELGEAFTPQIITGMESLSRNGDLENMKLFLNDLAETQAIPERFQRWMKESDLISVLASLRNVDHEEFLKSEEQVIQEDEANAERERQLMAAQEQAKAQGNIATEAAKGLAE